MTSLWGREPAVIVAFVEAVLVLAIAFGFDLTAEQLAAIVTVATLALGVLVRSQVTPAGVGDDGDTAGG